jgi:putative ABC transport system permease protein
MMSQIEFKRVTKTYVRGGERLVVLDAMDFAVPAGDFVALMGPSGSGKSTILNLAGGLDRPDEGEVLVAGTRVDRLGGAELAAWRARNVGFVFQAFNLVPVLSALENVMLPLNLQPLTRAQRRAQAEYALEIVGLQDRMKHRPGAARRDRARDRHRSGDPARRRADRRSRPRQRRCGDGPAAAPERGDEQDHPDGHARSRRGGEGAAHAATRQGCAGRACRRRMMRTPWILARRHLRIHWVRSGLTVAMMAVAVLLFATVTSLVTTLQASVDDASETRLITQSAVSLFVVLPTDYEPEIRSVPGVREVTKFLWFGGYYQEPENFFAQFAVDPEPMFRIYGADFAVIEVAGAAPGEDLDAALLDAMRKERRACMIGAGLARDFGWKPGDTIPLIGDLFQKADGSAWEFVVAGIYDSSRANFDNRSLYFRHDYLLEMVDSGLATGPRGAGLFVIGMEPGHRAEDVCAGVDARFAAGPQRTSTSLESALNAAFVSMMGNVPFFVATIGGAVVAAVFFSVINTMLLSARKRIQETGILKALGFADASIGRLVVGEALFLTLLGGALGIVGALGLAGFIRAVMGKYLPAFAVEPRTLLLCAGLALLVGLIAGLVPAFALARLRAVQALRSEG